MNLKFKTCRNFKTAVYIRSYEILKRREQAAKEAKFKPAAAFAADKLRIVYLFKFHSRKCPI
nr:hypothetical protein [uncultured Campylobacter sp.]